MQNQDLIQKYHATVAKVGWGYDKWVYSKARDVDLNNPNERHLVEDLSHIMAEFRVLYKWAGVSSNNIYWDATDVPLKVIQVPKPRWSKHITVINPEIKELSGKPFTIREGCGSLPGEFFYVSRKSYVRLTGKILRNQEVKPVELKYGSKQTYFPQSLFISLIFRRKQSTVQHELDHLEGKLLLEYGVRSYR